MKSIWQQDISIQSRKSLQGNINTQTVVIGAGMAGILIAYFLKKQGHEVIVVEAREIASGQTKNTTAKITSQHGLFYNKMIRNVGIEKARLYARANEQAIKQYEQLIREEKIDCQFERLPSYLYSMQDEKKQQLKQEAKAAASLGIDAKYVEGEEITELPFKVSGAVCFENQAQFQPLAFITHLAQKLEIYEHTKVLEVKEHTVVTDQGKIQAQNIVFATHYPITNIPGCYFLRLHQERSYVMAIKAQKKLSGMYYSCDEHGLSLRSTEDNLLLGGGAHRTGKKHQTEGCCQCGYSFLQGEKETYYPDSEEISRWAAQDCMSHDDIPFIGRYSMLRPYWYVVTGFKKWGMTSAMIAANMIATMIDENQTEKTEYMQAQVFAPQRFLFRASIRNLLVDILESTQGLTKGIFSKRERRCQHMGCKLEWNDEEQSWDCPCHGSRFQKTGELQDNPAQIDLHRRV